MKYMVTILICIFFLAGCVGNQQEAPATEAPTPEPTEMPTEAPTEKPEIVTEPAPVLLGQAETELLNKDNDRVHNIILAADSLDGYELAPGEVFSFNRVLGDRTQDKGYRDATVYVKGHEEEECGGGVCQVSTTLYQAAEAAGMTIIERHNHQKAVAYATKGTDAAVNYGTLDMKFKNNTDNTVSLSLGAADGVVTAEIYQIAD